MSDKDSLIFIKHILESINNIENFTKNVERGKFLKDKEKQSAVIRQIEIIGEAAKNLPYSFTKNYSNIPWKEIIGTRDKMIHHYFGVDLDIVWDIVKENLPLLKSQLEELLKQEI